ncbi:hypothetical protein ACXYUI_28985, partial [Klebsiella pneumoniae]
NGNGGNISLIDGTTGAANLIVANLPSVSGVGVGNGGNIILTANKGFVNVLSSLQANAGATGNGGTITITSLQTLATGAFQLGNTPALT